MRTVVLRAVWSLNFAEPSAAMMRTAMIAALLALMAVAVVAQPPAAAAAQQPEMQLHINNPMSQKMKRGRRANRDARAVYGARWAVAARI